MQIQANIDQTKVHSLLNALKRYTNYDSIPLLRQKITLLADSYNISPASQWYQQFDYMRKFIPKIFQNKLIEKMIVKFNIEVKACLILREYDRLKQAKINLYKIQDVNIKKLYGNQQAQQLLQRETKRRISKKILDLDDMQQFFQGQLGQIMDILHRRGSLGDYLDILVAESRWETNSLGLGSVCRSMTLTDLTVLLLRATAPSNAVPLLLAQQSAAVPISYAAQGKLVNDERLLSALFGPRTFPIVLNIWTPKAAEKLSALRVKQSKEKAYFCELLGVDPKSFEGSAFEGVVNLFRVRLRGGREILLVSTISYGSDQQTQAIFQAKRSLIQRLKNFASLLVFHIDADFSLINDKVPKMFFDYHFLLDNQAKTIYISQLSPVPKSDFSSSTLNIENEQFQQMLYCFPQRHQQSQFQLSSQVGRLRLFLYNTLILNEQYSKQQANYNSFLMQQNSQQADKNSTIQNNSSRQQVYIKQQIQKIFIKAQQSPILFPKLKNLKQIHKVRMKISNIKFKPIVQIQKTYYQNLQYNKMLNNIKQSQKYLFYFDVQEYSYRYFDRNYKQKNPEISENSNHQQINNQLNFNQQSLLKLQQLQEQLKNESRKLELSEFVRQCILFEKRNSQKQRGQLNQGFLQEIKSNFMHENLNFREANNYQNQIITIDNIIEEISIHNELVLSTNVQRENSHFQVFINEYYQKCLAQLRPFALINGETSNFGNEGLRRFFKRLNERYDRAKVFVVSVIGTKDATGKSALLNYLFRYNTAFIEDPYAKGVYMSLCKIDNKTIVVLDALGVFQIDATEISMKQNEQQLRKTVAFDHQVASLLIKESDLVIISSQLTEDRTISAQTQLIINVCSKVLDALYTNSKEQIIPTNIILTFSQVQTSFNQQVDEIQLCQYLINAFKPLQKYIVLGKDDIFFVPKIQNDIIQSLVYTVNKDYGFAILYIRNRIRQNLETIQNHRTFIDFLQSFRSFWLIIRLTTQNIVQVTSKQQIINKQNLCIAIKSKYIQNYNFFKNQLDRLISQKRISNFQQKIQLINQQQKKLHYKVWIYFIQYCLSPHFKSSNQFDQFHEYFITLQRCQEVQLNNQQLSILDKLIDQYSSSVEVSYNSALACIIYRYYIAFQEQFQEYFQKHFEKYIKNIFIEIMSLNSSKQIKLLVFERKKQQILKEWLSSSYIKGRKQFYSLILHSIFKISSFQLFQQSLQIVDIKACLDFESKLNDQYQNHLNMLIYFPRDYQIAQDNKNTLKNILKKYIKMFISQISMRKIQYIKTISQHMEKINFICSLVDKNIKISQSQSQQTKGKIHLNYINFKILLFAKLFKYYSCRDQQQETQQLQYVKKMIMEKINVRQKQIRKIRNQF